jgi:tRNA 2-selenouridine synthase SelU
MARWNLLRLGRRATVAEVAEAGATTIEATTGTKEMVVVEVIPEAIAIQMTGRSEERKIGHLVSKTTATETIEGVMAVMETVKVAGAVVEEDVMEDVMEDVTIEDLAPTIETANAERKTGKL